MPDFRNVITQNGVVVSLNGHTHSGLISSGNAFPGSPAANTWFLRNDLGQLCQFDGTRWLGPEQTIAMPAWGAAAPWAADLTSHLISISGGLIITNFELTFFVNTTNNASNYWTIQLYSDATGIGTAFSTSTYNPNVSARITQGAIGSVVTPVLYLGVKLTKTGSPGTIHVAPMVKFRRVYT